MRYYWQGNTSLVSLIVLSGIFSLLFIAKDYLLSEQKITQNFQSQYLMDKLNLIPFLFKDEHNLCQQYKQEKMIFSNYSFLCQNSSIFVKKPTKNYVDYQQINQYLNIDNYSSDIYQVKNLSELPNTSITEPKIVQVLNSIDDTLINDFYGIIITEHYFDIKGKYNIYGVLYSSYNNKRKERNLTYKKEVIENIEKQFSNWSYLPNSKSLLPNAENID